MIQQAKETPIKTNFRDKSPLEIADMIFIEFDYNSNGTLSRA